MEQWPSHDFVVMKASTDKKNVTGYFYLYELCVVEKLCFFVT